ncbi:ATP-grasp domain-containing protein [Leptothrix discophora]|uniref:ATP-grasp domain-containing protein n=1 Tax=Leptothrix discophora TaxID=89 RepID=A0ABT9G8C5_LEPDI|nr:ATP-grasp domain-containing protein [Leptothrix discophora]MDP4302734.1 ATP-grasp domain-containing protein [Leptothrix discophora]
MSAPVLVVAGLSVRALAQAARRDGCEVIGLDLFGDADTRAACRHWLPLARATGGEPGVWQIDPASLRAAWAEALRGCAAQGLPAPLGLLLGSGFAREGADLADLPVLGSAAADIAVLRDPARFFGALKALGIEHPPVSLRPVNTPGWLRKDLAACGGAHVQPADGVAAAPGGPGLYWQQRLLGEAMSLTLVAAAGEDGGRAALLGLNRLLTHAGPDGASHGHGGVIGPLPWTAGSQAQLQTLADRLVRRFRLRGLVGIDLLLVAGRWQVLEINPRPTASLVLYGAGEPDHAAGTWAGPGAGLVQAHLRACRDGAPPDALALAAWRGGAQGRLRGCELVRSPVDGLLSAAGVARLQAQAATLGLHDLPAGPQPLHAGAPVCSVQVVATSAHGDAALVRRLLERRVAAAQALLIDAPPAAQDETPDLPIEIPA